MKSIARYNYNEKKDDTNGQWFRVFNIKCDECGVLMQEYITLTNKENNVNEKDHCSSCLKKLFSKRKDI